MSATASLRRTHSAHVLSLLAMIVGLSWGPSELRAQAPTDSVRTELARLAALVDSLGREVARLRAEGEQEEATDALADLRAAAAAAASVGGAPPVQDE